MDVAVIEPGQDFRKEIDRSVASCSVLLAVIGPHWLDARDGSGARRLDDAADFVRIELASGLRAGIPVVPVLVRGSRMPRPEELPDDMKELAYRNGVELTHARWKSDIQLLIRALHPYLEALMTDCGSPELSPPVPIASSLVNAAENRSLIDPHTVERLIRELANYLGPIANMIVKRAAKQSASVEDLCTAIAQEIVSDADRARFLRACRG